MDKKKKIMICDDSEIVHLGLKSLINGANGFQIVDQVSSWEELSNKLQLRNVDILIIDPVITIEKGINLLSSVKDFNPTLQILVFTKLPEQQYGMMMLKYGISGYVKKDDKPEKLIKALEALSMDEVYLSSKLISHYAKNVNNKGFSPHEALSDREFDIMLMLATGFTIEEISKKLYISKRTLSNYKYKILKKMQLRSNSDLTLYKMV